MQIKSACNLYDIHHFVFIQKSRKFNKMKNLMNKIKIVYIYIYVSDFTERYYCGGVSVEFAFRKRSNFMKKQCKKFIAVVMTLIMMAGITGGLGMGSLFALIDTYAAEAFSPEQKIDEYIMKDENGNPVSGDGWALYTDEELVITGDVAAAEDGKMPWDEYLDEIKQVSVMDGVTAIPDGAFKGIGIDKIYIPASVKSISKNAFDLNENGIVTGLTAVYFGGTKDAWDGMNTGITIRVYSGHMHEDGSPKNAKKADCDGGYEGDCYCKNCGALSKQGKILDEAHDWGELQPLEGKDHENHTEGTRDWAKTCKKCGRVSDPEPQADPDIHKAYEIIIPSEKECGEEGAKYTVMCSYCEKSLRTVDATEHNFGEEKTREATCTESGEIYQECAYCAKKETIDTIPALGHNMKEGVNPPTCEKAGEKYNKCTREDCGYIEWSEAIPVHTLGYYETEYKTDSEATCSETGSKILICKKCREPIVDADGNQITQTLQKNPDNHIHKKTEIKEATCTEDGYEKVVCNDCGKTLSNTSKASTGHNYELEIAKSCIEGGGTAVKKCTVCGATREIEVPARSEHDLETVNVSATCTEKGYTYQRCKVEGCGYESEHIETTAALDHDLKHKTEPATCTEDGREYDYCTRCKEEFDEWAIPKLNHKNAEWRVKTKATCTGNGEEEYYCPDCKEILGTRIINKLGHDWEETTYKPNCEKEGYKEYKCTRCEKTEKGEITPALGHDWDYENAVCTWSEDSSAYTAKLTCKRDCGITKPVSAKIDVTTVSDPTCTVDGKKKVTATFDEQDLAQKGDEKYIPIPATGHNWDYENAEYNWNDDYSACVATVKCKNDNCTQKYTIDGTVTSKVTKAATCTETGTTKYTAAFENEQLKTQTESVETKALGHDFTKSDHKDATCTEAGYDRIICSRCSEVKPESEQPIQAKDHDWDYENAEYNWNDDYSACVATVKCKNDNCTQKYTIDGTVTSKVTKAATCTEKGEKEFTAVFANKELKKQTKVIPTDTKEHTPKAAVNENEIPATCSKAGSYDSVVYCSECGKEISRVPKTTTIIKNSHSDIGEDGICDECGCLTNTKIHIPKDTEISYYSNVDITATVDNLPKDYRFVVNDTDTTDNIDYESADGKSLNWEMSIVKNTRTLEFEVIGSDNTVAKDENGNALKGTCKISVKTGFFSRLIGVIRYIFGRTKTEVIKP